MRPGRMHSSARLENLPRSRARLNLQMIPEALLSQAASVRRAPRQSNLEKDATLKKKRPLKESLLPRRILTKPQQRRPPHPRCVRTRKRQKYSRFCCEIFKEVPVGNNMSVVLVDPVFLASVFDIACVCVAKVLQYCILIRLELAPHQ